MNFNIEALKAKLDEVSADELARTIVDAPFTYQLDMVALGIGIMVFLVADAQSGIIYRVALSRTNLAKGTLRMSDKKFEDIDVPLGHAENIIARAIATKKPQVTDDWKYLFTPALTPGQSRMNQAGGGIACSFVYPVSCQEGEAALIFSYYKFPEKVGTAEREFMQSYAKIVSQALDSHEGILATIVEAKARSRQD